MAGGFGLDCVRQGQPIIVRDIADLQIVTVGRSRVITLKRSDVNVIAGGRVNSRPQAAFLDASGACKRFTMTDRSMT